MIQDGQAHLRMVDIYGKQVSERTINLETGTNSIAYEILGLAPGVYILNIEVSGQAMKTQRMIITK